MNDPGTITTSKIPIHTYVNGYVASAASLLSIVGDKRYMTKNSVILIHQLRMNTEYSKYNEIKDFYENSETLMNIIKEIVREQQLLFRHLSVERDLIQSIFLI